jgi:predicted ATPase
MATQIALPALLPHDSLTVVWSVAQTAALPAPLAQAIITKAGGNPFFLEELTWAVVEEGHSPMGLTIPDTIQAVLAARIDRLPPAEKRLLQVAAVIGPEVPFSLLQAIADLPEDTLQHSLGHLRNAEFLYEKRVIPEPVSVFKHVLTQEVAYRSLLQRARQQYHRRIAQVLADQFPSTVETQPELLAHHYTEAGLNGQAIPYWQWAGQRAIQGSAYVEALAHLTKGLEVLKTLPETPTRVQQELGLQIALGPTLSAIKGAASPEVEQTYARARALCLQVGETPQLFPTLWGLWRFYLGQGALPMAQELGEQLLRLAQRSGEPTHLLEAYHALGDTLFFLGEYTAARTHLEQGIALTDPATQRAQALLHSEALGGRCLDIAALTLWCLGYPAQAVQRSQEAQTLAQTLAHPHSLAVSRFWATTLHYRRREVLTVQMQAEALLTLATAQRFPLMVGYGTFMHGWALAMQGQGEAGLAQMHQGLAAILATGQSLGRPRWLVMLAEAAGHAGEVEEGVRLLAEALTAFEARGLGDMLVEAYRLQGELLLCQAVPDVAQAEASFQQALAIARRQQAKSWELRAAVSLSRLWQRQGKRVAARTLLAPVYGWFTEGFDTADLQEAKALLEELGE